MKISRIFPIICLLLCAGCPLTAAEQGVPAPEEAPATAEQQQALQEYIRIRKDCLSALRGVCNKETADAAAELTRRYEKRLEELLLLFRQMDPESISSTLNSARLGRTAFKKEMDRLLLADFYGSAALSDAIMETPVHALPAQELPQNIRQELEKRAQEALRTRGKLKELVSGGPGFTQESAWILTAVPDIRLMDACSMMLSLLYTDTNMLESAGLESSAVYNEKLFTDDKALIRICVDIIPTGDAPSARYRFTQWFDVSSIVPYRSEADVNQAVLNLLHTIQQITKLAENIRDKDSADASAEKFSLLVNSSRLQLQGFRWLNENEFMDLLQEHNINADTLFAPLLKLREADFYGSEKLRNTLRLSK